jgi:hypothetical protein
VDGLRGGERACNDCLAEATAAELSPVMTLSIWPLRSSEKTSQ